MFLCNRNLLPKIFSVGVSDGFWAAHTIPCDGLGTDMSYSYDNASIHFGSFAKKSLEARYC